MIHSERRGPVTILKMDHGKVNAIDVEFLQALADSLAEVEKAGPDGPVVLTGTGNIFSAGVDLFRLLKGGESYVDQLLQSLTESLLKLFTLPRPVVASINGHAIAGGCVLACACDYRIMAKGNATIGVPELRVGVPFPGVALEIMRFATSRERLQELLYLGKTYTPDEACQRGLVDEIVDAESLIDRACDVAESLAQIGVESFAVTKRQLRAPSVGRIAQHPRDEPEVVQIWKAPETHAAIRSYLDATLGKHGH